MILLIFFESTPPVKSLRPPIFSGFFYLILIMSFIYSNYKYGTRIRHDGKFSFGDRRDRRNGAALTWGDMHYSETERLSVSIPLESKYALQSKGMGFFGRIPFPYSHNASNAIRWACIRRIARCFVRWSSRRLACVKFKFQACEKHKPRIQISRKRCHAVRVFGSIS